MATYDAERVGSAPWLLTGPALLVFLTLLAAPLARRGIQLTYVATPAA